MVTWASPPPASFPEPSLPCVWLPARMVWGSLTHFSVVQEMSAFSNTFLASPIVFLFWLLQGEILIPASSLLHPRPHPCPWLHQHTPTCTSGLLPPFFSRNPWKGEKRCKEDSCLPWTGLSICFCSGLLVGVQSSMDSYFLPSSFSKQSPLAIVDSSPACPPLPVHSGALSAGDQGPGRKTSLRLPPSSGCFTSSQSSGSPRSHPGARGQ